MTNVCFAERSGFSGRATCAIDDGMDSGADGVKAKLEAGANVADVGCGHGASTILMAQAFPKSHFFGFDYHGPSIEHARKAAREAASAIG